MEFNRFFEELKGKNVGIFAICAQSQGLCNRLEKELSLNFKCLSDPTHTLRNYLAEQGYITIAISGGENSTRFYKVHPYIKHYKHGVAQPGVLCIRPDKTVLYAWAINPSFMNLGGGIDRPVPAEIWTMVQTKLADPENADKVPQNRFHTRVGPGVFSMICTLV